MRRLARCVPQILPQRLRNKRRAKTTQTVYSVRQGEKKASVVARSVSARYSVATAQFGGCGWLAHQIAGKAL